MKTSTGVIALFYLEKKEPLLHRRLLVYFAMAPGICLLAKCIRRKDGRCRYNFCENLGAAGQDPLQEGNGSSVVGYGDGGVGSTFEAVFHLALIEGAASAVDDQPVFCEIGRKFGPAGEFKLQPFLGVRQDPAGQLYSADIVALSVMCTAFAD